MNLSFSLPSLIAAVVFLGALYLVKKPPAPSLSYSHLSVLSVFSWRARLAALPKIFKWLALTLFLIAFADPYLKQLKAIPEQMYKEGIAIYLVLDHSGSMLEKVPAGNGELISKLDILKQVTRQFIEARPNDLIGIVGFARSADPLTPLTLDHAEVLEKLATFSKVPDIQQEGTAIGYAIFKTVNLIEATRHFTKEKQGYDMKDAIIVLVTDGFQDPNPLDTGNKWRTMSMQDAAAYAKKEKVKLYLINVEPAMATEPYTAYRNVMQRVAELTGGKFYLAGNPEALNQVYQEINHLQKSPLLLPSYTRHYLYPYLIAAGMGLLLLSLVLETTCFRRAP